MGLREGCPLFGVLMHDFDEFATRLAILRLELDVMPQYAGGQLVRILCADTHQLVGTFTGWEATGENYAELHAWLNGFSDARNFFRNT